MFRGVFVTGTDTGIGKTVVSAALMRRYRGLSSGSRRVRYWKPIQTGIERSDDTKTVAQLSRCGPEHVLTAGVRLRRAVSPHLAARLSGTAIDLSQLVAIASAQGATDRWVVEGAGGVLVPVNDGQLMIDLMARLALPAVVVARTRLGTINHTLLTLEALRRRALPVAAVVMVGPPNADNRAALEEYGQVPVIGELPPLRPLTARRLGEWATKNLDRQGRLEDLFR